MARASKRELQTEARTDQRGDPFRVRARAERTAEMEALVHSLGEGMICETDRRGHQTPRGKSPLELVVDASEGFVPLWEAGTILRWRFREQSLDYFEDPVAAKQAIRSLFAEALVAWGAAAPVMFKHDTDLWDFEIAMMSADQCNAFGCTLAAAFFPDAGRHQLKLYPKLFTQTRKEQVDTFVHELGHVFGLRHFFAQVGEKAWPSEIFGQHAKFSIMNYGALSELTETDKEDLTRLYELAWSGELPDVNGTPIRLVRPFSALAAGPLSEALSSEALRPAARARVSLASRYGHRLG
jgi:hypothetical protein